MINLDSITNENNKEHNEKWPYIPDHPYKILITGGSGSGKTNALFNLIKKQDDIDKYYLYAKDLSEPKYDFLIKKRKDVGIKHLNDPVVITTAQLHSTKPELRFCAGLNPAHGVPEIRDGEDL